jgi:hypothetical protein
LGCSFHLHIIPNNVELAKLVVEEQLKLHPKDLTVVCVCYYQIDMLKVINGVT